MHGALSPIMCFQLMCTGGGGGEKGEGEIERGWEREGREKGVVVVVVFRNKSVSKLRQNPTSTIENAIHCIFNYFILHEGVKQSDLL